MGVEIGGGRSPSGLAITLALVAVAAVALVLLVVTAAPGDRGIPEERPTTADVSTP